MLERVDGHTDSQTNKRTDGCRLKSNTMSSPGALGSGELKIGYFTISVLIAGSR